MPTKSIKSKQIDLYVYLYRLSKSKRKGCVYGNEGWGLRTGASHRWGCETKEYIINQRVVYLLVID